MWVARVKIESWCWRDSAGNVRVVNRLGVCGVGCIIGRRCARVDGERVLDILVVISRWRVFRLSISCVCRR